MLSFSLTALLAASLASAIPCVQFDTNWQLYAFGGTQDVSLGQSSSWGSPTATPLSTDGRPPWTGNYSQCLLSQYNNAMYVIGADASDLSKIYVYSFAGNSWTTQTTSSAPSNLGNSRSASILDHDTNVLFTLPTGGPLYQLDLSTITTAASSSALAWESVNQPSFSVDGYTVTAAQSANHISYFGVPGTAAGSADLFIVHFATFQPAAQTFPTVSGGSAFPDSAGQAFSIPASGENVPYQIVFVPNDFSNSYVVTHWTDLGDYTITSDSPMALSLVNSTQLLPPPPSQDTQAAYAASPTDLVQIDASGNIHYLTNAVSSDYTVGTGSWSAMNYVLAGTGGTVSSASASASASGSTSASQSGSVSASSTRSGSSSASGLASASASGSASSSGAATKLAVGGVGAGFLAAVLAFII